MELSICDIISFYKNNKNLNVYEEFKKDIFSFCNNENFSKIFDIKKLNIFDIKKLDNLFNNLYMDGLYQKNYGLNVELFSNKNKIITVLIIYIHEIFHNKYNQVSINKKNLIKSFLKLYIKFIEYINKTKNLYLPQLITLITSLNHNLFIKISKNLSNSKNKKEKEIFKKLNEIYKKKLNYEKEKEIALNIKLYNEILEVF